MRNFKRIGLLVCLVMAVLMFVVSFVHNANAQEKIVKEMVLQVNPDIISLPGNEAARVPITAARIRSTQLRNLNEEYNAVRIEKLFRLKETAQVDDLEIKGLKDTEEAGAKKVLNETVNVAEVFTRTIKKEQEEKGKQVEELNNVFIVQFESDEEISMNGIVNAYKALPVVMFAQHITRTE